MNSNLQNEYEQARNEARALVARVKQQCEQDNRRITSGEQALIQTTLDRVQALERRVTATTNDDALMASFERTTGGMTTTRYGGMQSIGSQFINSAAGRWLRETKNRPQHWETPIVEINPVGGGGIMSATITENPTGGGIAVPPMYLPGIVPVPLRPAVVADLLGSGTTGSNAVVYMAETAYTVAAAAVAEGAAKPESAITFTQRTDLVAKIAHWLPVTDEALEDLDQLAGYIDARLRLGVGLTEEDQLLNGNGTAPNMLGLLNRPGLAPPVVRTDPDTNADAIGKAISAIQATTYVAPTGVIMHPKNFETIVLSKTTLGSYVGSSPFQLPLVPMLWGKPVAVTTAIPLGSALVVTQSAATVFRRGGINVQASNAHQDFFIKNLVAVRAEERLALACFRAAAFGLVTGLN